MLEQHGVRDGENRVPFEPRCILPPSMGHVQHEREKLIARVGRIRGQLDAIGRALAEDRDCGEVLQQIAAVRGAVAGLMAEVIEGHVREHVAGPRVSAAERQQAADELVGVLRRYLR